MTKIYVASSNEDKRLARDAMKLLASQGYAIHDWTKPLKGYSLSEKSDLDYKALCESDHVIFVNAMILSPGKYIEIGTCRALHKSTFFIGKPLGVLGNFGTIVRNVDEVLELLRISDGQRFIK